MADPIPNTNPSGDHNTADTAGANSDLFLERAKPIDSEKKPEPPSPWLGIVLTVGAPVAAIVVGYYLLLAINIGKDSAAYSTPRYAAVRSAVTQALDRDLAAARLEEILAKTEDPSPYVAPAKEAAADIEKGKAARLTARTADLKTVAARLNSDRALLAEALTLQAMSSPQSAQPIETRLTDQPAKTPVGDAIKDWVSKALDPWAAAAAKRSVKGETNSVVATAINNSLALHQPLLSIKAAMSTRFDGFIVRTGESWWTNDVGARLSWAIVTLLFLMTFAMAAFTSGSQLAKIGGRFRWPLFVATAAAALAAAAIAASVLSPSGDETPLHRALNDFARQLSVLQMVGWSSVVNQLRAIGLVMLIAGSAATFAVKIGTLEELADQLRGFKSMFNVGTVFLFAGVLEVYALFRWPVVFAADETTRGVLNGVAASFAAAIGVLFTVVLFTAYLATTIVVRRQAIAIPKVTAKQVDDALKEFGFSDLLTQQGLRLAQALLPLLPGFVNLFS